MKIKVSNERHKNGISIVKFLDWIKSKIFTNPKVIVCVLLSDTITKKAPIKVFS